MKNASPKNQALLPIHNLNNIIKLHGIGASALLSFIFSFLLSPRVVYFSTYEKYRMFKKMLFFY